VEYAEIRKTFKGVGGRGLLGEFGSGICEGNRKRGQVIGSWR